MSNSLIRTVLQLEHFECAQNGFFGQKNEFGLFFDPFEWAGDGQKQSDIIMRRSDKKEKKEIQTQSYKTYKFCFWN